MTPHPPVGDRDTRRTTAARDDQSVAAAVAAIGAGRPVVVTDDADRENEGDLIFAAEHATPEMMALLVRYSSGVVCVPMTGADLDRLQIPLMVTDNRDPMRTAFTVTVDATTGVGTGISAADRARTVRVLADPQAMPSDLNRPGHLFPLRAQDGGVLQRRGHTEAAVDLARSAGLRPAAVISELVNDDGTMMRGPQLHRFAEQHGLLVVSIEQLAGYRRRQQQVLERVAETALPTEFGTFTAHGYRSRLTGIEHVALVAGKWRDTPDPPLVRVHSECLTGDAFGSLRCDCGPQLHDAMAQIAGSGGILIYLRGQEGRGIGLTPKLRAYQRQEAGLDTVDANLDLGLPADARDYAAAAQILRDLGADTVRLLSNNPDKVDDLSRAEIEVQQVPTAAFSNRHNLAYLRAKRDRMGHEFADLGQTPGEAVAMTGEHR